MSDTDWRPTAWQGLEHVGWMNDAGAFLWLGHPSAATKEATKYLRPVFAASLPPRPNTNEPS